MKPQLLAEINQTLASLGATSPVLQSQARVDKVFEIFVWSCVLRALRQMNASLSVRNSSGVVTATMEFRLGPGLIFNPTSTPGFVKIGFQGKEYELHSGLRVLGRSKVLHELDLCILKKSAADRCRRNRINPDSSSLHFLAECKFYGSSLPLSLGREYLGLTSEFSIRVKTLTANQASPEVHRLVKSHKGTTHFDFAPSNQTSIDHFVGWLATELKHSL